eukprot:COSAG06_NODE_28385_length_575_cov_1.126050_1_plen_88_part_10
MRCQRKIVLTGFMKRILTPVVLDSRPSAQSPAHLLALRRQHVWQPSAPHTRWLVHGQGHHTRAVSSIATSRMHSFMILLLTTVHDGAQ